MRSSDPETAIDELVRSTFVLRIFAVLLTVVSLTDAAERVPGVIAGLVVCASFSLAAVHWWDRLAPLLRTHPAIFAGDVALSCLILILAGPVSPFFVFTLASAMLAGILYGRFGAVFFAVLLSGAYGVAVALWDIEHDFMTRFGLPSMYVVFGLGAERIAGAYRAQAHAAQRLAEAASVEATVEERARLARELHDSVAKSVVGLALQASALTTRLTQDESPRVDLARQLSDSAEVAARESRAALVTLREGVAVRPFPELLDAAISRVERDAGAVVGRAGLDGADIDTAVARTEVLQIVTEALRNAVAHAGTDRIGVAVRATPAEVEITVTDQGRGFEPATAAAGRFGLRGMHERAALFGGDLTVTSAPGDGTSVRIRVPRTAVADGPNPGPHLGRRVPA